MAPHALSISTLILPSENIDSKGNFFQICKNLLATIFKLTQSKASLHTLFSLSCHEIGKGINVTYLNNFLHEISIELIPYPMKIKNFFCEHILLLNILIP